MIDHHSSAGSRARASAAGLGETGFLLKREKVNADESSDSSTWYCQMFVDIISLCAIGHACIFLFFSQDIQLEVVLVIQLFWGLLTFIAVRYVQSMIVLVAAYALNLASVGGLAYIAFRCMDAYRDSAFTASYVYIALPANIVMALCLTYLAVQVRNKWLDEDESPTQDTML
ncbi:hypothetical protein V3C99_014776 [Haemonchus contortus]|uniref:Conserved plasma membrane protein n=1 Tax=Haemonchus contortus TaxID=6289 RepID=A0A7I4YTT9_HAECO